MNSLLKTFGMVCAATALMAAVALNAPAQGPSSDDIEVRWVMAGIPQETDPSRPISVAPEARLRSGDRIKMYLNTRNPCFFYLFHQGPDGRLRLLFPASLPSPELAGGTRLTVPQGEQWFELDEQTGTENFHVLVSATPLEAIETLYRDYLQRAAGNGSSAEQLLSPIEQLGKQQRPLTSDAERPLSIGGTIRGAADPNTETTEARLDRMAEDIATRNVFCRTYTIEHH